MGDAIGLGREKSPFLAAEDSLRGEITSKLLLVEQMGVGGSSVRVLEAKGYTNEWSVELVI